MRPRRPTRTVASDAATRHNRGTTDSISIPRSSCIHDGTPGISTRSDPRRKPPRRRWRHRPRSSRRHWLRSDCSARQRIARTSTFASRRVPVDGRSRPPRRIRPGRLGRTPPPDRPGLPAGARRPSAAKSTVRLAAGRRSDRRCSRPRRQRAHAASGCPRRELRAARAIRATPTRGPWHSPRSALRSARAEWVQVEYLFAVVPGQLPRRPRLRHAREELEGRQGVGRRVAPRRARRRPRGQRPRPGPGAPRTACRPARPRGPHRRSTAAWRSGSWP